MDLILQELTGRDCRKKFDDRPGGYAPNYYRDGPPAQRRLFDDGYRGGSFAA